MDSDQAPGLEVTERSSSSSSSSPSHPQSFPSSPSSKKERSAPSSSASSSSSSSPFSPSNSPTANHTSARSIADSSQLTSRRSAGNSSAGILVAAIEDSNGLAAIPNSFSPGNSSSEPIRTENGSVQVCRDIGSLDGYVAAAGSIPSSIGIGILDQSTRDSAPMSSEADLDVSRTGNSSVRHEHNADTQTLNPRLSLPKLVVQDSEQKSGPCCEPEDLKGMDRDGKLVSVSPEESNRDIHDDTNTVAHHLEAKDGVPYIPRNQAVVFDNGTCSGQGCITHSALDQRSNHSSEADLDGAATIVAESEGNQELVGTLLFRPLSSAPDLPLKVSPVVGDEVNSIQLSSSKASPGLQRAQTMPSGSLEGADRTSSPTKHSTLMRSHTDLGKEGEVQDKEYNVTSGSKLSKRKQKKLMKRIFTVKRDGTVEFDVAKSSRFAPQLFGPEQDDIVEESICEGAEGGEGKPIQPRQIAMLIVGTRGDVQPFVAIGKHLQEHGHRVRLATHSNFKHFVLEAGLEFFPLGGDPKVLAEYMVKNKGFLPSGPSEIRTQRKQLKSIINSLLDACVVSKETDVPFHAQAIIANPPAYGHVHVAEALKVPLHIFFTMPWTPTSEFPHPLSRVHHLAANRLSYQVVDSLIWWGIRDLINDFRKKKLNLRPITYLSGSQLSVSKLPTGYIWSPQLVPKPKDWGSKIDVVGFCFLNLSHDYKPPDELVNWLGNGAAPIYVGFGSLPVEDPQRMTEIIVEALRQTSQRGVISKGWGGIGNSANLPNSVYLLEDCPHDWLFPQCAAVVHHGGAGTTAAGLKAACPTTVVPFFGDQPFWGEQVQLKGVGPAPIPVEHFSLEKLVNAINYMMNSEVKQRANALAEAMKGEDGVAGAVRAFHKHLPREIPPATPALPSKSFFQRILEIKTPFSCFDPDPDIRTTP